MSTFYVEPTFYIATDQEVYTKMIAALAHVINDERTDKI